MNKVRNIHKGNDIWTQPENTDINERPKPEGQEEEYLPNQMH